MLILQPESRERIWGTPRLHAYSGDPAIKNIGSVYSVSGIPGIDCRVAGTDKTLNECVEEEPKKFGLVEGEVFPLIISFTACDENLSIQVHPTDEYAEKVEHMPYGKSEAWYFITPPADGWIYAEQQKGDKTAIQTAVENNDYAEVLKEYPVGDKEFVYIPAGTIHALTKGSLVYEIQQATDITYRFYDYDRTDSEGQKRELHVEKAISTLIPEQKVEKNTFAVGETLDKRPFTVQHLTIEGQVNNPAAIASVLTILSGEAMIAGTVCKAGMSAVLLPGETVEVIGSAEAVLATPNAYWR